MSNSKNSIDQPVALVTGASSGIGAAIARALAQKGIKVICAARNEDKLKSVAEELDTPGHVLVLDVTNPESVTTCLDRLPEELRDIDILVANAGHDLGGRQKFAKGNVDDWTNIIDTNVNGVIRVCHKIMSGMLVRGTGHIVTMGSIDGFRTRPDGAVYCASKYAIHALTETIRADYRETPLRVTEIMPGLVRSGFAAARWGGDDAVGTKFYDSFPQALDPEDIASCVVFAIEAPAQVNIAQVVVVPTNEPAYK